MKHPEYYLGVSGHDLDGLDIVLADLQEPRPISSQRCRRL